jgi:hypothetical protein
MQMPRPGGIALVQVAEAPPLVAGQVPLATVAPFRDCRPAEPARLATPEKMERVSVTKDTP